jgi:trk system potassium uptake protein TrkH
VFHAVSAFNNAKFSTNADSPVGYVTDPWISLIVAGAVILGGLGFPVVFELARCWRRPALWSVMIRLTVTLTVTLLVLGTAALTLTEFTNPDTLGLLGGPEKLLAGLFASAMTRTARFNSLGIGAMRPESLLAGAVLMCIGGGSVGTAGGTWNASPPASEPPSPALRRDGEEGRL